MYINPVISKQIASPSDSRTTASDPNVGTDATQTFLTLLMAQLKTQDPLSPMDPNQMVTQLVQFNSLGQLMSIRQLLEGQSTTANTTTAAGQAAGGQ